MSTLDWWTIAIYLILVVAGWFTIYAASYDLDNVEMFDFSGRSGMQLIWICVSLAVGFLILLMDSDWYDIFAYWIYILILLLLIATLFLAPDIKGSRSWLVLGPIRIQPAEFAKFATSLALAKLLSSYRFELSSWRNFFKALVIFIVPMLLIFLQKEAGSALVFLAFFLVLYREGMSGYVLFIGFCAILYFILAVRYGDVMWNETSLGEFFVLLITLIIINILLYNYKKGRENLKVTASVSGGLLLLGFAVSLFIPINLNWVLLGIILILSVYFLFFFLKFRAARYLHILLFALGSLVYLYSVDYVFDEVLKPHQRTRIQVTLGIIDDPGGAGYNVNQSKIAIGSGGFAGKGFLNGTQTKLKYVPEQDTDFIFCTIGEEEGFWGSSLILLMFLFLILRLVFLSERQKSTFARIYGYCVLSIFFLHVAINIGMVLGITPVIGIPLPFFSYGGSSILAFTILLFIFLRLDSSRKDRL